MMLTADVGRRCELDDILLPFHRINLPRVSCVKAQGHGTAKPCAAEEHISQGYSVSQCVLPMLFIRILSMTKLEVGTWQWAQQKRISDRTSFMYSFVNRNGLPVCVKGLGFPLHTSRMFVIS